MQGILSKSKKGVILLLICLFLTGIFIFSGFSYESPEKNPVVKFITGEDKYAALDIIEPYDYILAMHYLASLENKEFENIINNPEVPNFQNTLKPLVEIPYLYDLLNLAYNANSISFNPLNYSIYLDIDSFIEKTSQERFNNEELKGKIQYIWENEDRSKLSYVEKIILEEYYGKIDKRTEREEIININGKLDKIYMDFLDNLYTQYNEVKMIIPDEGLIKPYEEKFFKNNELFDENGQRYWEFDYGSISEITYDASSRALREESSRLFNSTGILEGYPDNRELLREGINLRLKLAQLEGYNSYADLAFAKMGYLNKEELEQLFLEINDPIIHGVKKYWDEVRDYRYKTEGIDDVDFVDSHYYKFNYNYSSEIRDSYLQEYDKIFEFEAARDTIFELFENLYEIEFVKDESIPVPNNTNIQTYRIVENSRDLGVIYFDFFYREDKKSSAFVLGFNRGADNIVNFSTDFSENNLNGKTTLSIVDISVFLHEMGHLVHNFFSQTEYPGYSGYSYSRTFKELPSQLHELYAWEPEFINKIISKTKDESLLKEYYNMDQRLIRARDTYYPEKIHTTYLISKLDQDVHSIEEPFEGSILGLEKNSIKNILFLQMDENIGFSYRAPHLLSGNYSSGYYTYLISEIMGFDAFKEFKEKGIFDKETGEKFRKEFLAQEPTENPETLYENFTGHKLSSKGLIEYLESINFN